MEQKILLNPYKRIHSFSLSNLSLPLVLNIRKNEILCIDLILPLALNSLTVFSSSRMGAEYCLQFCLIKSRTSTAWKNRGREEQNINSFTPEFFHRVWHN